MLHSLLNNKVLNWSKFKDEKINVALKLKCFGKGRKHCGKRRKCWLPAFSPFSTMFSKVFFHRVVTKSGLCSKDYKQKGNFIPNMGLVP